MIESILWAHHKLKIMPHIQPRALSISQGRAVGFIHYTLGGVGCTWAKSGRFQYSAIIQGFVDL